MKKILIVVLFAATAAIAQTPSNLVVEGVPVFPDSLREKVQPYFSARSASFTSWNPAREEMLIATRFADVTQLHVVKMPGGARTQLTFYPDRVGGGRFRPRDPNTIFFTKDVGGNEFFQIYRYDVPTGEVTLLTDGKSRNTSSVVSRDGKWLAYASTQRTGKDTDVWISDPMRPGSARMLLQLEGGGWGPDDISPDGSKMLVGQSISAAESYLWVADMKSGEKTLLTAKQKPTVAWQNGRFSADGKSVYAVTNEGSEFLKLVKIDLASGKRTDVTHEKWDVDSFDISEDGKLLAYETNESGISVLHLVDLAANKKLPIPKLPAGLVGGLEWHSNNHLLGFSFTSAKSPADAYSYDVRGGKLTRWTMSETGGLNPERNVEPELVTIKSFDGTPISAFVYRPDPAKFPGKRPALMDIHGGPEGQSRPGFLGRSNFWINELGIALIYPNVRGSTGYGKTFLELDNGMKREDSVKDIGALIQWIKNDPRLDGGRIGVYGGSYGGYMTLATATHYNDDIRAAIDVVGISNFVTFMKNTSGYRVDLRRVEYGDERDPQMNAFLQQISPMTSASKITKPLFVIAGFNDPRVPWTEGEQMVKTVRANGAPVWWLMAKDEGHGFAKRVNQDYQFLAMTMFLQQFLL
jgi:dipeptidyl aminopeptidase/acylaminoacyl peptidase